MKKISLLLSLLIVLICTSCSEANSSSLPEASVSEHTVVFDDEISPAVERKAEGTVNPEGIKNKIIAGYQGWFSAPGDGNNPPAWKHWNIRLNPGPEFGAKFDLYPDISEYTDLYQTDFADLGNGSEASLFSSFNEQTVDTHFKWMQQYGVDCAAVQRFGSDITKDVSFSLNVMNNIVKASAKYGRAFYICYDVTGYSSDDMADRFINDFISLRDTFPKLSECENYLTQDGKPVIQIWGIGVAGNYNNNAEQAEKLIKWFRDNGFYVIGGVGANWRTEGNDCLKGYSEIYDMFDMISPWLTGRFNTLSDIEKYYETEISEDIKYCRSKGIDYMPVMFPGFSWANWYPDASSQDRNAFPRRAGETFWKQAELALASGADSYYLAMFDEYDEGTAFAKAATDSTMIPTDHWFLTYSADGTWLSSDFYLRLIEAFNDIINNKKSMTFEVPVPYSEGPIYFRSSFEYGIDVQARANAGNIKDSENFEGSIEVTENDKAYLGSTAVMLSGKVTGKTGKYMSAFCNNINVTVTDGMKLRYFKNISDNDSKKVFVDILCTDGTKLSDCTDIESLYGGQKDTWQKIVIDLSPLKDKTIQAFLISYSGESSGLKCYFDDVLIYK